LKHTVNDPTWLADDDGGAAGVTRCSCPRDPDDYDDPGDPISTCPIHGWSSRVIDALDAVDPDDCPVKATHHKMIDTCAICGQEPRARLELGSLTNKPGGRWWEVRVMGAVLTAATCARAARTAEIFDDDARASLLWADANAYTDEVTRLVTMAERHAS
jgi:hypothetical protein